MNYRYLFCVVSAYSFTLCVDENKLLLSEYTKKVEELRTIQQKLHINSMQHHEQLFNDLQTYGRAAGQVASSVILLVDQTKDKSNSSSSKIKLSGSEQVNIVQSVVTAFVLMVELAKYCHAKKMHKKMISLMDYQDFVYQFPHLIVVEHQILLMKMLINLTIHGTVPEQIFSIITLTKMSLPAPYAKFANKAAKKMQKKHFDQFGNFEIFAIDQSKHPYKKFSKKVVQGWKEIALKSSSFPSVIDAHYDSTVAFYLNTELNNSLIKMIHAGIKGDIQILDDVRQKFLKNQIVQELYDYYVGKQAIKL